MSAIPSSLVDCEVITLRRGAFMPASRQFSTDEQRLLVVGWSNEAGVASPITLGAMAPGSYAVLRVGKLYYGLGDRLGTVFKDYREAVAPFHASEPAPALTEPAIGPDHWGVGDGPPSGVIGGGVGPAPDAIGEPTHPLPPHRQRQRAYPGDR